MLQVALVTLGRHIGLLNNWYCQPEETEVSDTHYHLLKVTKVIENISQIPSDSVLFPLSTYLTGIILYEFKSGYVSFMKMTKYLKAKKQISQTFLPERFSGNPGS